MDYLALADWDGMTVLEVMKKELGLSSAYIKHLKFIPNGIMIGGSHVTVRAKIKEGDILSLALEDGEGEGEEKILPSDIPISVIYEDGDVAVPNKPSGMPTHPSHGHYGDTLANALAFRYGSPFVFRPVNRLDRNTSGLVLIARNRRAAARLADSMRQGRISKLYLAVLNGVLPHCERSQGEGADPLWALVGIIDTHMRRTAQSIIVREVCSPEDGGDRALTYYLPISVRGGKTLAVAMPVTGRTHQLRVHFAHLGCPLEGDDMYGAPSDMIDRHALHAMALGFPHPSTGEYMRLEAPLHPDMDALVSRLFGACGDDTELWEKITLGAHRLRAFAEKQINIK